jgi:hypothetical protein
MWGGGVLWNGYIHGWRERERARARAVVHKRVACYVLCGAVRKGLRLEIHEADDVECGNHLLS